MKAKNAPEADAFIRAETFSHSSHNTSSSHLTSRRSSLNVVSADTLLVSRSGFTARLSSPWDSRARRRPISP